MSEDQLKALQAQLWPRGERRDLWMILDAARDERIYSLYLACSLEKDCLYAGALGPELALAAPYLVRLEYGERSSLQLLRRGWGQSWGVFLKCDHNLRSLRRHLRTLLVVRGPKRERLVFRYYDPRVMRVFIPTCTPDELRELYGPIECFWAEGPAGTTLGEWRFSDGKLTATTHAVADS